MEKQADKMTAAEHIAIADATGYSELAVGRGLYLCTGDFLTADDGDDYSAYPYWLTTDSGTDPEGFNGATDFAAKLETIDL